jgi:hypothetical protein
MKLLKAVAEELIGLFVDDGSFAALVLVWLGVCWLLLPRLELPSPVPPALLFVGLVVILAESALRRAGGGS